jgi:hypothetical protein
MRSGFQKSGCDRLLCASCEKKLGIAPRGLPDGSREAPGPRGLLQTLLDGGLPLLLLLRPGDLACPGGAPSRRHRAPDRGLELAAACPLIEVDNRFQ